MSALTFSDLARLEYSRLDSNRLASIDVTLFGKCSMLVELYLSQNGFAFDNFQNLTRVELSFTINNLLE